LVELFEDGYYRVLHGIGNLYDSSGLLLSIPTLGEDEYDEEFSEVFYDNAEYLMRASFDESLLG
jgi:hypothetical protein